MAIFREGEVNLGLSRHVELDDANYRLLRPGPASVIGKDVNPHKDDFPPRCSRLEIKNETTY